MLKLKSKDEINTMKEAGAVAAAIRDKLIDFIKPGITTLELDKKAEKLISSANARAAFKGYQGYPANINVSLNEEVVHGIPSSHRVISEGDIVSIDLGVIYKGYYSDTAATVGVGVVSPRAELLIDVTRDALYKGIEVTTEGNTLFDIAFAIESYAKFYGFSVITQLVGHGIGKSLHEDPQVPNYVSEYLKKITLKAGLVLAIEPMIAMGSGDVVTASDNWTVITRDRSLSAHFEHTVAILPGETMILTL